MTSGVRLLLTVLAWGGAFFLTLVVLGAMNVNAAYVQMPGAALLGTLAIWPLVRSQNAGGFTDWVAYNATLMLIVGLVIYSVDTWIAARTLIGVYSR